MKKDNIKILIAVLIILTIAKGLLFAIIVPKSEVPDEPRYFSNIKLLAHNKIPYFKVKSATGHPVLYEAIALPLYLATRKTGLNNTFFVIRLLGIVFFTLTVLISYLITKEIFPDQKSLHFLVPLLITLNPQASFMASGVNSESLLNLLFSLFLLLILKLSRTGLDFKLAVFLPVVITAGLLTKERFLIALPLVIISLFYRAYLFLKTRGHKVTWPKKGSGMALISIAAAVAFFYLGKVLINYIQHAFISAPHKTSNFFIFINNIFKQYWGNFGWLQNPFPKHIYLFLAISSFIALSGLVIFTLLELFKHYLDSSQRLSLFLLGFSIILAFFSILSYEWRTGTSQGRYFFIVIVPLSLFLGVGFYQLLAISKKSLIAGYTIIFVGLATLNIYSLIWQIFPFYH